METMYANLKMLGYRFWELNYDYFLTIRPDGNQCLFNKEGNIVKNDLNYAEQLSEVMYLGIDTRSNQKIIFDNQSNIIECVSEKDKKAIYRRDNNCIIVFDNKNKRVNVYEQNFKAVFKLNNSNNSICNSECILKVIEYNGNYNLMFIDSNHNLKLLDTKLNITEIPIKVYYNHVQVNNHYVTKYLGNENDDDMEVINYKGETICKGYEVYIDTINMNNDIALSYEDNSLIAYYTDGKVKKVIDMNGNIMDVSFTSNPNVICVNEFKGAYLLNIDTLKRTPTYSSIYNSNIGKLENGNAYIIDIETFKHKLKFQDILRVRIQNEQLEVVYEDREEFYRYDFKPLIKEFKETAKYGR